MQNVIKLENISNLITSPSTGVDPGFKLGGGGALKKITPSGGRRENVWGISRFYDKKSYFFQF